MSLYNYNKSNQVPCWGNMPMYNMYPYPLWGNPQMFNMMPYPVGVNPQMYNMSLQAYWGKSQMYNMPQQSFWPKTQMYKTRPNIPLKDYGPDPFVVDINDATEQNNTFRTALWTGRHLQVTLMSIPVGSDIGLEVHEDGDQFIRIEEGSALVQMGDSQDNLNFQRNVSDDYAIMIPAGKWHNIINVGDEPLKLYAIYAPPEHPAGTVHNTQADAEAAEAGQSNQSGLRY